MTPRRVLAEAAAVRGRRWAALRRQGSGGVWGCPVTKFWTRRFGAKNLLCCVIMCVAGRPTTHPPLRPPTPRHPHAWPDPSIPAPGRGLLSCDRSYHRPTLGNVKKQYVTYFCLSLVPAAPQRRRLHLTTCRGPARQRALRRPGVSGPADEWLVKKTQRNIALEAPDVSGGVPASAHGSSAATADQ